MTTPWHPAGLLGMPLRRSAAVGSPLPAITNAQNKAFAAPASHAYGEKPPNPIRQPSKPECRPAATHGTHHKPKNKKTLRRGSETVSQCSDTSGCHC